MYACFTCSYETDVKSNFTKHIGTKKHKELVKKHPKYRDGYQKVVTPMITVIMEKEIVSTDSLGNTITKKKPYQCRYCSKEFNDKSNCNRHENHYCKHKSTVSTSQQYVDNNIIQLEGQIKNMELEDEIKDSLLDVLNSANIQNIPAIQAPTSNTTSNTTNNSHNNNHSNNNNFNINNNHSNNNNNNNVNQNIVVNQFGKETWDHVHNTDMFGMLKRPKTMIVEAFKKVHLNPEVPQNHNIMAQNKRDGRIQVKEGDSWVSKSKNETLTTIVDDKYYDLDSFYNRMKEEHPDILKDNMRPDEIETYEKFSTAFDKETDIQNVNNPAMQPMMNQCKDDCFYALTDFMLNMKLKRKEEREAAKLAKEKARLAKRNAKLKN